MNANPDPQVVRWPNDSITSPGSPRWTPAAVWMGWLLASSATVLSLAVSGLVGWQRGSHSAAQLLLAAIGILAVLGAHWLLAVLREAQAGIVAWLIGLPLWLACVIYVATSHVDFFIDVQARRADHRIAAVESNQLSTSFEPKRSVSAILDEEAGVRTKWMQARIAEANCEANCTPLNIRQLALKSRVATLEAEEEEARRWQDTQDRLRQRKEALRDDPVTSSLQRDFGVTPAVANSITVLPVAVILEGMGALCWCLVLQAGGRHVTGCLPQSVTARVTETEYGHVDVSTAREPTLRAAMPSVTSQPIEGVTAEVRHDDAPEQQEVRTLAAKVWTEIQQGQVKPTVRSIRASLGIAQEQARAVARLVRVWRSEAT